MINLDKTKRYNIITKYPYIFGSTLGNVVFEGTIYTTELASKVSDRDILSIHQQIKSIDNTINDASDMEWIILKNNVSNIRNAIGVDYILDIQEIS